MTIIRPLPTPFSLGQVEPQQYPLVADPLLQRPVGSCVSFASLSLESLSEGELASQLLRQNALWSFRYLTASRQDLVDGNTEQKVLYLAALGEILSGASGQASKRQTMRWVQGLGLDSETTQFLENYTSERVKDIARLLTPRDREHAMEMARDYLDMALQAKQEVGVCLGLAKHYSSWAKQDWGALVQFYLSERSRYERALIEFVQDQGGMVPFDHFFERAMFHDDVGTYTGETAQYLIGSKDDIGSSFFVTASENPYLARSMVSFSRQTWEDLGRPSEFTLMEMGAGMGQLAENILNEIMAWPESDPFRRAVSYQIIEKSPALAENQKKRLAHFPQVRIDCRSAIHGPLPRLDSAFIFSNELLDMFPPRKVTNKAGRLSESYIVFSGGFFGEREGNIRQQTWELLKSHQINLETGETYYLQPDLPVWLQTVSSCFRRGRIVSIDYGGLRPSLRKNRHEFGRSMFRGFLSRRDPKFSLMSLARTSYGNSPTGVARPKDMTVDVDFTALHDYAQAQGCFTQIQLMRQSDLLRHRGGRGPGAKDDFDDCLVSVLAKF